MIVVMIIAIIITIAVPQFLTARLTSWHKTCLGNLKSIHNAKELWAMENRANTGDAVTSANIVPDFIKGSAMPTCPGGGTYTIGNVGDNPTCTYTDPRWSHVLP